MKNQSFAGRGRSLRQLLARLRAAGYNNRDLLKAVVPEWWSKDADEEPDAGVQLRVILARRLGLDIQAIIEDDVIRPEAPSGMCFKRSASQQQMPSNETLAFCATLARAAAAAIPPSLTIPANPHQLRREIIDGGEPFISLAALLKYCWLKSIAVMHVTTVPGARKGMDALVYRADKRNIIIVTKAARNYPPAWLSFLIAHELGHIALGHVQENDIYADECQPDRTGHNDEDAANEYASTVLAGDYTASQHQFPSPEQLINWAYSEGRQAKIDPGHLVLHYAHTHDQNFAFALKAWKKRPTPTSYDHVVNEMALSRIDTDVLGDSMGELIENVLQLA